MDSYELAKLTPEDREQAEMFISFLQSVGPPPPVLDAERLHAWIDEDPETRRAYLGMPEREAERGE